MTTRNDWVGHLRHYSLPELRRRQHLNGLQIEIAHRTKNTEALQELRNMEDSLTEAIRLNEFA